MSSSDEAHTVPGYFKLWCFLEAASSSLTLRVTKIVGFKLAALAKMRLFLTLLAERHHAYWRSAVCHHEKTLFFEPEAGLLKTGVVAG